MNGMELIKSIPEVQEIELATSAFLNEALTIKVSDDVSMATAKEIFLDADRRIKSIDVKLDEKRDRAYRSYQDWLSLIKDLKAPYLKAKTYLGGEITTYHERQERIRREEQERLLKIALEEEVARRKKAEEEKLAQAALLEKAGSKDEAEQMMAEAIQEAEAPVIIEQPKATTPKVEMKGMAMVTYWHWEVVKEYLIPHEYFTLDPKKVNAIVTLQKDKANIPGIRVWSETKAKSTGR